MLVIRGILAWGRQRDMTQIRKCTINLPFIQNVCFIVVSWPIAALNKYITYLDLAFRRRAGVCLEGQICLLFPRVCKEQIMQISLLPDLPQTTSKRKSALIGLWEITPHLVSSVRFLYSPNGLPFNSDTPIPLKRADTNEVAAFEAHRRYFVRSTNSDVWPRTLIWKIKGF